MSARRRQEVGLPAVARDELERHGPPAQFACGQCQRGVAGQVERPRQLHEAASVRAVEFVQCGNADGKRGEGEKVDVFQRAVHFGAKGSADFAGLAELSIRDLRGPQEANG